VDEIEGLKPAARRALGALRETLAGLARDVPGLDAGVAVQEVLSRTGLLARLEAERTDEATERAENLVELVAAAREFDESLVGAPPPRDPDEPVPPPLSRFLEQIALLGEADAPTPEGRVSLMTLHAAKGLEFTAVVLSGLEEGTFPRAPWGDPSPKEEAEAYDEERRLCYVGMTRAKKRLTLTLARRRMGYGDGGPSWRSMEPSRFLSDLPPELFGADVARAVGAREAAPRGPVIRRQPGSLPGEPHIELEGDAASADDRPAPRGRAPGHDPGDPVVDYEFDQRPEAGRGFVRGDRVVHPSLGSGSVVGVDGAGRDAKVTVRFELGEKRVLARFLARA
jgi:DNA helicase-2/ATP-dependent DNA helicase PcrA